MRGLDLFSGAGGATRGYQMAGFEMDGVDIKPQLRYVGERFFQADALEYVAEHGHLYDFIHASPPCQKFTSMSNRWRGYGGVADTHIDLIEATRRALSARGVPYIIENVVGARRSLRNAVKLTGGAFGLRVERPRLFESNVLLHGSPCKPVLDPVGVYGIRPDGRRLWTRADGSEQRAAASMEEASLAMGIDWMEWDELKESIPPAYTHFIGEQLRLHLEAAA